MLAACGAGCAASDGPPEPVPQPASVASGLQPVAASVAPALRALAGAIEEGEDDLARQILERLRVQPLGEREHAMVVAFERILTGRELVRAVACELVSERLEDESYRLVLRLRQETGAALRLRLPPADLVRLRVGVDPAGLEGRDLETRAVDVFGDVVLGDATPVELELARYSLATGRALAVRDLWQLEMRSGEIGRGDDAFPAGHFPRPRSERVVLAPDVSPGPSTVADLLAEVADPQLEGTAVLRTAVRLPDDERDAALAGLAPLVARLARESPERVRAVAPALRWVARTQDPGADPATWASWLARWVRGQEREGPRPRLELPARRAARDSTGREAAGAGGADKLQRP